MPPAISATGVQETMSLYHDYTNSATLVPQLLLDAQDAERRHRRQGASTSLWSQRDWFLNRLKQLQIETRESIQHHETEDDDDKNQSLRVRYAARICARDGAQDAIDNDMRAAFDVFGEYLAHQYIHTQISIARDDVMEAAEFAALVLSEAAIAATKSTHLAVLDDLLATHHEAAAAHLADYNKSHANRVFSFRTEQQHLASRSDASQLMYEVVASAIVDINMWLQPSLPVESNIKLLVVRLSQSAAAAAGAGGRHTSAPERGSNGTRLLLFCRELADSITEIRGIAIENLQEPLRNAWEARAQMLAEMNDAISASAGDADSLLDAPWESRLPVMAARDDLNRLLPHVIEPGLRARLEDYAASLIVKVQRPLPVRPRGARDQCENVLRDLRDLLQQSAKSMKLETAWNHLPCVLWSETYSDLLLRVNADDGGAKRNRDAISLAQPSVKRVK
jgi:hypothetical protein